MRKKFDDVFIRFDTLSAVTDGHVDAGKTAERRAGNKTRNSADADNRLDAYSSQSRSTNMVPFSVHCDFSLSM